MTYDVQHLVSLMRAAGIPDSAYFSVSEDGAIEWASPAAETQWAATYASVLANYTPPPDYAALINDLLMQYQANNLIASKTIRQMRTWRQNNITQHINALPAGSTKSALLSINQLLGELVEAVQFITRYMRLDSEFDPPEG